MRFRGRRIDFDETGPRLGGVRLLRKSVLGFEAPNAHELAELLGSEAKADLRGLTSGLDVIARALNSGDLSLAALATSQLRLEQHPHPAMVSKAKVDDPVRPGYPAGEPDRKGGQFRPKDMSPQAAAERADKAKRLARRRSVRAALKRVLSSKRLLRLLGENALAAVTEAVPVVDVATTAAAIADDLALLNEVVGDLSDAGPAAEMAEDGPVELQDLQVGADEESFESFAAFKKIDLEKRFGPAGDGYHYHHLAEQGSGAGDIAQTDLQSTSNIVRIPRLLHEEINSYYATPRFFEEGLKTPRELLRNQSFGARRAHGIDVLRHIGAVK